MKKTYITTLPNQVGAFLKASRTIADLGLNITRASYNKAIDSHTLFIQVEGSEEQLAAADERLMKIGYLRKDESETGIILLEFHIPDAPGAVTEILELISSYNLNISYISSRQDGSEYQHFKIGLLINEKDKINSFLEDTKKICEVRVIDYNKIEKNFDNSFFYNSFVSSISECMNLGEEAKMKLAVNANLAMQLLDEHGLSPYKTFDSIGKFAEMLAKYRGEAFCPRISNYKITDKTEITVIEPPCGSNTMIIKSCGEYLFVDSGYACYKAEMKKLIDELIPDIAAGKAKKNIVLTHADVDHCGLLDGFDVIYASEKSKQCISSEYAHGDGFREKSTGHKPYIRISKILTSYQPVNPDRITVIGTSEEHQKMPLKPIGYLNFGELCFELFEGQGGHLPGEIVLIDYQHKISFTGDIYFNVKGLTPEQQAHNQYAPILMTSVDSDSKLAAQERKMVIERLGAGSWKIFGSHGMMKDYTVVTQL
jgi:glyoxylase-like metal-dependent hydrolase (beta-lactamase superfamily II)